MMPPDCFDTISEVIVYIDEHKRHFGTRPTALALNETIKDEVAIRAGIDMSVINISMMWGIPIVWVEIERMG